MVKNITFLLAALFFFFILINYENIFNFTVSIFQSLTYLYICILLLTNET